MGRARVFVFVIGILMAAASMVSATTVYLYADTAPNVFEGWKAAAFSAAANGTFVNMASGAVPGTSNFVAREAVVYSGGDNGRRLHWVYWLPGETVEGLAGRFAVKDVADWDSVAYAGEDIDGPEIGWSVPENWINYDANGDGVNDGVVGTFGNGWHPEATEADINATIDNMMFCQTYWKGIVRFRDSINDPWQIRELQLSLVAQPGGTITATAGSGGAIDPSGATLVSYGGSQMYVITPNPGFAIADVTVDDVSVGVVSSYTFSNVTTNHSISATFSAIPAFAVTASAGAGGSISPSGVVSVNSGASQTFAIAPNTGYTIADVKVDNASVGAVASYTFGNVTANHTIEASFSAVTGGVPRADQLVKSWVSDSLPASGSTGNLTSYIPSGQTFTKMGGPTVDVINGAKWINNHKSSGDGFDLGLYAATDSIPCNGASIVMAVKPVRDGVHTDWVACFNVFTYTLSVGVRNDTGNICARRNSTLFNYPSAVIPDGQTTILSMIVQPDGTFKIYANGTQIVTESAASAFTQIAPTWSGTDSQRRINLGRSNGATWSCFNGYIGDTFFYKVALTDAERQQLEALLASKFIPTVYQDVADLSALARSGGNPVRFVGNAVVTYAPRKADSSRSTTFFYIGEAQGTGGIKVVDKTGDDLMVGKAVSGLVGTVSKSPVTGECTFTLNSDPVGNGTDPVAPLKAITPLGMNGKSVLTDSKAPTNLVKIWGKVKNVDGATSFVVSDGYDNSGVTVMVNGVALPDVLDTTKTVVVTGVLTRDNTGSLVVCAQSVSAVN